MIAGAALAVIVAAVAARAEDGRAALKAPFDVAAQRATFGKVLLPLERCPVPPPAPRDLIREDFYVNKSHSVADPAKRKATLDTLAPLWSFTKAVGDMADGHVMARPPEPSRARCTIVWLDAWAKAQALTGEVSTWARYDTLWATEIGAALAYLKVRDTPGLDAAAKSRIEHWIVRLARAAVTDNDKFIAYRDQRKLNPVNLTYWTAAAAMLAAVVSGERDLYAWGVRNTRRGLVSVRADGALPGEMERQARAFVYHVWAMEPLMLAVSLAAANGDDLTHENNDAVTRIVRFMLAARADPQAFEKIAGHSQQADSKPERWPRKDNATSLEIYLSLRPDPEIEKLVKPLRPVTSQFLGTNTTLTFARD